MHSRSLRSSAALLLVALAAALPALAGNQIAVVTDVKTHVGGCDVGPATVAVPYAPTGAWTASGSTSATSTSRRWSCSRTVSPPAGPARGRSIRRERCRGVCAARVR
jgi:hypothetical protein